MEKYLINQNIITSNGCFHTGKNISKNNIDYKFNTIILPKKLPTYRRITFFPIKNNLSDLALTNRQIEEETFSYQSKNHKNSQKLKLEPLNKSKLYKNNLKDYSTELRKNKSYIFKNYKNKMNESIQSDLFFDEDKEDNKIIIHQNSIIDCLLNKKMNIKPKLRKIQIRKKSLIENIKHFYGKGVFLAKYEKKFLQNSKPVQYYFKVNMGHSVDRNNNISKTLQKTNKFLKNNNLYQTFEFCNMNENKFVTKLTVDESDNKVDKNFDCHGLMKYPVNMSNKSIYNDVSNDLSYIKTKFKTRNLNNYKNSNKIISYDNLKLLSQRGFKKFEKNRYKGFEKKIRETFNIAKDNRKKYDSLAEINLNNFNKNKKEIFQKDL